MYDYYQPKILLWEMYIIIKLFISYIMLCRYQTYFGNWVFFNILKNYFDSLISSENMEFLHSKTKTFGFVR
jgi:hypothetical protein